MDKASRVEIHGSAQEAFANNPTVKVFWNGREMGALASIGGHFAFDVDNDGQLVLRSGVRSAKVQVSAGDTTSLYLRWDRIWGRLLISRTPTQ